jgi:hypothetical protein
MRATNRSGAAKRASIEHPTTLTTANPASTSNERSSSSSPRENGAPTSARSAGTPTSSSVGTSSIAGFCRGPLGHDPPPGVGCRHIGHSGGEVVVRISPVVTNPCRS